MRLHGHAELGVHRAEVVASLLRRVRARRAAEVGVNTASTSEHLLRTTGIELLGVDPFLCDNAAAARAAADRVYAHPNATLLVLRSLDAAPRVADGSLDLVFIDGIHSYEACAADIVAWTPKVRAGGIVCGHDYGLGNEGVLRAVQERVPPGQLLHVGPESVWWFLRP